MIPLTTPRKTLVIFCKENNLKSHQKAEVVRCYVPPDPPAVRIRNTATLQEWVVHPEELHLNDEGRARIVLDEEPANKILASWRAGVSIKAQLARDFKKPISAITRIINAGLLLKLIEPKAKPEKVEA